jgi:hypothetical protein
MQLVCSGTEIISYITRARVPMPKTTGEFIDRLRRCRAGWDAAPALRESAAQ